jgi:chaperonin GroES
MIERAHDRGFTVTLDPLDDWLVIEPVDAEGWTRAGLIIPANADETCRSGLVSALGPDVTGVELGDKVLFPRDLGYDVRIGSGTVRVIKREDLIARIQD